MSSGRPSPMRHRLVACLLVLAFVAGCGGDEGDSGDGPSSELEGTFVGKASDADAFVAIVVAPAAEGEEESKADFYVCDAARLCESLTGSVKGDAFKADSGQDDGAAEGELSGKGVSGQADLGSGKPIRYRAKPATAASGVYELEVSADGKLRGASEAGVALTGESSLPEPGPGTLKLADGTRLEFAATPAPPEQSLGTGAGEVVLIVLSGGEIRGAGTGEEPDGGGDAPSFFLRSSK